MTPFSVIPASILDFGFQIFTSKPGSVHTDLSLEKNQVFTIWIMNTENVLQPVQFIMPKEKKKKKRAPNAENNKNKGKITDQDDQKLSVT